MSRPCKELKRMARANLNNHYSVPMGAFIVSSLITMAAELPFSMLQPDHPALSQTIIFEIAKLLISLLGSLFLVGQLYLHINMARKKPYATNQIFYCFKNHPDRYLLVTVFLAVLTLVCALPFLIGFTLLIVPSILDALRAVSLPEQITVINYWSTIADFINNLRISSEAIGICLILAVISLVLIIYVSLNYTFATNCLLDHPEYSFVDALRQARTLMKGHKGRLLYMVLSFLGMDLLMVLSAGLASLWIIPYQMQTYSLFYLDLIGEFDTQSYTTPVDSKESITSGTQFDAQV